MPGFPVSVSWRKPPTHGSSPASRRCHSSLQRAIGVQGYGLPATKRRQLAAVKLASTSDVVVVIGEQDNNTRQLTASIAAFNPGSIRLNAPMNSRYGSAHTIPWDYGGHLHTVRNHSSRHAKTRQEHGKSHSDLFRPSSSCLPVTPLSRASLGFMDLRLFPFLLAGYPLVLHFRLQWVQEPVDSRPLSGSRHPLYVGGIFHGCRKRLLHLAKPAQPAG